MENTRKEVAQTNDRGLQRLEHRALVDSAQREVSSGWKGISLQARAFQARLGFLSRWGAP